MNLALFTLVALLVGFGISIALGALGAPFWFILVVCCAAGWCLGEVLS